MIVVTSNSDIGNLGHAAVNKKPITRNMRRHGVVEFDLVVSARMRAIQLYSLCFFLSASTVHLTEALNELGYSACTLPRYKTVSSEYPQFIACDSSRARLRRH